MKKISIISSLIAAAMVSALISGCGLQSPETSTAGSETQAAASSDTSDAITLVYAEVNPIDSVDGRIATYFKEKVAELSGGSIIIDIQANGVLGAEADILDGMTTGSGTVDLCRISCFDLSSYGCPLSTLLSVPFTFENRDHYWAFTETEVAQRILAEPAEYGLGMHGLYFQEEGFRDFFMVGEVNGMDDLKGKKIRVSSDPILTAVVEQLGASATVISFNELYTALQTGVVDGGDQPVSTYESNVFYEVAPNVILDQHTMSASELLVSDATWDSLTAEQQAAITEAGEATSAYAHELSEQDENESIERLKEKGVIFTEVTDFAPWRAACASIISEYTAGVEDEYSQITDLDY